MHQYTEFLLLVQHEKRIAGLFWEADFVILGIEKSGYPVNGRGVAGGLDVWLLVACYWLLDVLYLDTCYLCLIAGCWMLVACCLESCEW